MTISALDSGKTFASAKGHVRVLEDAVEFFNVVLGTQLTVEERQDMVAYSRVR